MTPWCSIRSILTAQVYPPVNSAQVSELSNDCTISSAVSTTSKRVKWIVAFVWHPKYCVPYPSEGLEGKPWFWTTAPDYQKPDLSPIGCPKEGANRNYLTVKPNRSFQKSGALLQTPNSKAPATKTQKKRPPPPLETAKCVYLIPRASE